MDIKKVRKSLHKKLHSDDTYIIDPEEDWDVRPDVAGYRNTDEGYKYRIGVLREIVTDEVGVEAISEIINSPFTPHITRNLARAVITKKLLQNPPNVLRSLLDEFLESVISLEDSGNSDLNDCYQIILGRNHPNRQTSKEQQEQEIATAETIFQSGKMKPVELAAIDTLRETFTFHRLTMQSDQTLILQYNQLMHETFGDSDGMYLLDDEETIFIVAVETSSQKVVCGAFAWADINHLKRNGKDVQLYTYEIEGAVVRREYGGKGLYKAVTVHILQELAKREAPSIDVVFGFCNLSEPAVLAVAAQTGKTLVTETARELGLHIKPSEQQDYIFNKAVDDIVTYIPGNKLRKLYGKKNLKSNPS